MPNERPPHLFVAGSVALDFLNTIASPFGEPIEWLVNGEDLLVWLEKANLITCEIQTQMCSRSSAEELDSVAKEARALREWFRGFVRTHKGKPLSARALKQLSVLNELLERDKTYLSIRPRARPFQAASALECSRQRRFRTPSSLLFPLAEAMATLVSSADFSQVKQCEGDNCTLLMLDTTQRHARRWCAMAICGNRAKQAAHRTRLKQNDA